MCCNACHLEARSLEQDPEIESVFAPSTESEEHWCLQPATQTGRVLRILRKHWGQ